MEDWLSPISFTLRFFMALCSIDIIIPIIGSDFLAHFHLLPNIKGGQLMNDKTGLETNSCVSRGLITVYKIRREHALPLTFKKFSKNYATSESTSTKAIACNYPFYKNYSRISRSMQSSHADAWETTDSKNEI